MLRLFRVRGRGLCHCLHSAEAAAPCAEFPHNHERCCPLGPAFGAVGAMGALADRMKIVFFHKAAYLLCPLVLHVLYLEPVRLAGRTSHDYKLDG